MPKGDNTNPAAKRQTDEATAAHMKRLGVVGNLLRVGVLAKADAYHGRVMRQVQLALEREILDRRGEVTAAESLAVNSFVRHELRARLLQRKLSQMADKLTVNEYAALWREISDATERRDKAFTRLGIEKPTDGTDPWKGVYDIEAPTPATTETKEGSDK